MKTGMFAWLICSGICINALVYGQVFVAAYFLVLSCVLPTFLSTQLRQRRRHPRL